MLKNRALLAAIAGIVVLIALPVLWWLVSPLFIRPTANDATLGDNIVIVTPAAPVVQATPAVDMDTTMEAAAANPVEVSEPMPTEIAAMPESQVQALLVVQGQFRDGDAIHTGSGDALLFQLDTGEHILRFENFSVINGPDLHVYLVPRTDTGNPLDISGYVDLGELRGAMGDQNYTIPADVAASVLGSGGLSVVIWCEPFGVLFSAANLTTP